MDSLLTKIFEFLGERFPGVDTYLEEKRILIKTLIYLLITVLIAGIIYTGVVTFFVKEKEVRHEDVLTKVRAVRVAKEAFADTYTVMGTIRGAVENDLRFEIEGTLMSYNFQEGAPIKRNQIIALLDPKDALSKVSYAKGRYNSERSIYFSAAQRLKVYQDLYKMKAISETKLQESRYEATSAKERMNAARSEVELAQSQLEKTNLTAPNDGILAEILIQQGEFITPHDVVAKFVSQGDAVYEVDIPEKDVITVKIGMNVKIHCDAYPDEVFDGTIDEIAPTVKEKTRTSQIRIGIPNEDGKLRSGMFARGDIVLVEMADAILVPPDSIIKLGDETKLVPLVIPNRAKPNQGIIELRHVTIGQTTAKAVVIEDGLKPGELLVVETQGQLSDGLPIQYTVTEDRSKK